jgi:hypothetical protein
MEPIRASVNNTSMLKLLAIGLLGVVATVGGLFLNQHLNRQSSSTENSATEGVKSLQIKTEMTGIPVVVDGLVSGYLVFQISSTIDTTKLPSSEFDAGPYVLDAAIRASYQSTEVGVLKVNAKYLKQLSESVREEANRKLNAEVVTAVNVEQFNFVPKDEIRGNLKVVSQK